MTDTLIRTDDGETATIQELRMTFEFNDWWDIECAAVDHWVNKWVPLGDVWWDNAYSTVVRYRQREA